MIPTSTLQKLRELATKATPGPWSLEDDDPESGMLLGPHNEHLASISIIEDFGCIDEDSENYDEVKTTCESTAAFIAAANPTAGPFPGSVVMSDRIAASRKELSE